MDWRCKLTWTSQSSASNKIFANLPSKNTIIWPYTPQFAINYAASYENIKTLQTNYSTPAYQNSDVSNIQISGLFTATNVKEANYLYAVIHFLKSATKGFNVELKTSESGRPPPVLKLNYLGGEAGITNMPVIIQTFNVDYPREVDYIRAQIEGIGAAMVPAEINIAVTLMPVYSRADMIAKEYSTTKFINGDLLNKGYF
jgi:hypothetical protein